MPSIQVHWFVPSSMSTTSLQTEGAFPVEGYKHTPTHTHTHTHTHFNSRHPKKCFLQSNHKKAPPVVINQYPENQSVLIKKPTVPRE